jgi:hypothetical protein
MHWNCKKKRIINMIIIVILYIYVFQFALPIYNHMRKYFTIQNNGDQQNVDNSQGKNRCLTKMSNDLCKTCINGWHGNDCGIPPHRVNVIITERETVSYIVQVTILNHEIHMLKLKIDNSLPYTDEFVVIEGDMTFALEPKEFYLQKYVSELQSFVKLRQHHVHIQTKDKYSWDVQNEMRLSNTTLHELYPDIPLNAIIIFTDVDECIRPEVLHFLKYYDSTPFPTSVQWNTYLFGFFFHDSHIIRPSSLGTVYQSPLSIRKQPHTWTIPQGGWHCRWCSTIEDIQTKLKSSPFVDLPRIADNPEFMKPSVIYDHIIKGKWFLGSKAIPRSEPRDVPLNTPIYMRSYDWWLQHPPPNNTVY